MAIAYILLAGLAGFVVTGYALVTGQVSLIGAVGLYISAGWAAIIAGVLVAGVSKMVRKSSVFIGRTDKSRVMMPTAHRPTKS